VKLWGTIQATATIFASTSGNLFLKNLQGKKLNFNTKNNKWTKH
jgi:hypothetical protein